jgi:hypothetical protein
MPCPPGPGLDRRLRFDDPPHTCTSMLLAQGVERRVVMGTLGHTMIGTTFTIDGQVMIPPATAHQINNCPDQNLNQQSFVHRTISGHNVRTAPRSRVRGVLPFPSTAALVPTGTTRLCNRSGQTPCAVAGPAPAIRPLNSMELTKLLSSEPRGSHQGWLRAATVVVGLQLAVAAWSLAMPPFSGPDEGAHVIKAMAVVRGELLGEAGDSSVLRRVQVPATYSNVGVYPPCYAAGTEITADCQLPLPASAGPLARAQTYVIRYPPLFYVLGGWPSLFLSPAKAVYALRLAASLPDVLLVAAALLATSRRRYASLGVLVAFSPMVLYLAATFNPNGLETAAAMCLWACGAALLRQDCPPWVTHAFGVAGFLLTLTRGLSPLWFLIIVVVLLMIGGRPRVAEALTSFALRRWLLLDLFASLIGIGYVFVAHSFDVLRPPRGIHASAASAIRSSAGQSLDWTQQAIGYFGWLDSPAPFLTYAVWVVVLAILVVSAVGHRRRWFLAVLLLLFGTFAGSIVIEAARLGTYGHGWRGRYMLPLLVGVPILLGWTGEAPLRRGARWIIAVAAGALFLAHLAAFFWSVRRYTVGLSGALWPSSPAWAPPVPIWLLLAVFAVGMAAGVGGCLPGGPVSRGDGLQGRFEGGTRDAYEPEGATSNR